MNWQVSAKVSGGHRFSTATEEEYQATARALDDQSAALERIALQWSQATFDIDRLRISPSTCAEYDAAAAALGATAGPHVTVPFDLLVSQADEHAAICRELAVQMETMAELLARAHELYDHAEEQASRVTNESLQLLGALSPFAALFSLVGRLAGGALEGLFREGRFNKWWLAEATKDVQEGSLAAIASALSLRAGPLSGISRTDESNHAASMLAPMMAARAKRLQGDALLVREVRPRVPVTSRAGSVSEALAGLQRLSDVSYGVSDLDSGLAYGTISIQKYRREDGSHSWLVTIPGTDGNPDSPFGWPQNIELMSDKAEIRRRADSARLVVQAMRDAGIRSDDPVALIGHSQGGIVAATIASDWAADYDIQHVVTAGSPVANHPIPSKTWVTSIEVDDELVAATDGAPNPATPNWLTVRGTSAPTPGTGEAASSGAAAMAGAGVAGIGAAGIDASAKPFEAAPVAGAGKPKESSHYLRYHQAAYQHASDLGSRETITHERHFQKVVGGELVETKYYEGRMSKQSSPNKPQSGEAGQSR